MANTKKKAYNKADVGFEAELWSAADVLRGSMDASEYKHVILGLIFLKYISDSFEAKRAELLEDPYADPDDKDEYLSENIFFVPEGARWDAIKNSAHTNSVGTAIDSAMEQIEKENPKLKGVLPKTMPALKWISED